MPTVLFSAPYMIPTLDRFRPVFDRHGIELIEQIRHAGIGRRIFRPHLERRQSPVVIDSYGRKSHNPSPQNTQVIDVSL